MGMKPSTYSVGTFHLASLFVIAIDETEVKREFDLSLIHLIASYFGKNARSYILFFGTCYETQLLESSYFLRFSLLNFTHLTG